MSEMIDKTGEPSTTQDIEDAISASKKLLGQIMKLPPEIAVHLPVIHRCLREYQAILLAIEKRDG